MGYSEITFRLKMIKVEISNLNEKSFNSVTERIDALKLINLLLKEQNQLLAKRQDLIIVPKNLIGAGGKVPLRLRQR